MFLVKRGIADDRLPSDCAQSHDVCADHKAEPLEEEGECTECQQNVLSKNGGDAAEIQDCLRGGVDAFLLVVEPLLQIFNGSSQALEEEPGKPVTKSAKEEADAHRNKEDGQQDSPYDKQTFVLGFAGLDKFVFQAF